MAALIPTIAIAIAIATALFVIGAVAGIVAVVSLGVKREDRRFLAQAGPDNLTRGARRLTGLYVKEEEVYEPNPYDLLVH